MEQKIREKVVSCGEREWNIFLYRLHRICRPFCKSIESNSMCCKLIIDSEFGFIDAGLVAWQFITEFAGQKETKLNANTVNMFVIIRRPVSEHVFTVDLEDNSGKVLHYGIGKVTVEDDPTLAQFMGIDYAPMSALFAKLQFCAEICRDDRLGYKLSVSLEKLSIDKKKEILMDIQDILALKIDQGEFNLQASVKIHILYDKL